MGSTASSYRWAYEDAMRFGRVAAFWLAAVFERPDAASRLWEAMDRDVADIDAALAIIDAETRARVRRC